MTFLRRIIPLAAILAVSCALVGQGTAVTVQGTNSSGVKIPAAQSINLPGSITAGTSIDSNGDLTVSGTITAGGDIEGNNLTGNNTGNVTIATGAASDVLEIGGTGGQVLDLKTFDANTVLAGPGSGSAEKPTFRTLVDADIPGGIARTSDVVTPAQATATYQQNTAGPVTLAIPSDPFIRFYASQGSSGTTTYTLPAISGTTSGARLTFANGRNDRLTVLSGSANIQGASGGGSSVYADSAGATITLFENDGIWWITSETGTWIIP